MKILVDPDICMGAGQCVRVAPDVFDQSEEAIVVLLISEPSADRESAVRDAVALCPSGAISIAPD